MAARLLKYVCESRSLEIAVDSLIVWSASRILLY